MYPKIAQFKTAAELRQRLAELDLALPVDDVIQRAADDSPLGRPSTIGMPSVVK